MVSARHIVGFWASLGIVERTPIFVLGTMVVTGKSVKSFVKRTHFLE